MKKIDKLKVWIYEALYKYFGSKNITKLIDGHCDRWNPSLNMYVSEAYKTYTSYKKNTKLGAILNRRINCLESNYVLKGIIELSNKIGTQLKDGYVPKIASLIKLDSSFCNSCTYPRYIEPTQRIGVYKDE